MKKHKVKRERPDGSSGYAEKKQTDLVNLIHDRVELLQQVFALLKPKEIKAMAPDCVRNVSQDDLKELCLEELLGISSKRLLSTLHGADPPSDTETSSDDSDLVRGVENLDTISLDSISSDEGALSNEHTSEKSKKRCKRREKRKKSGKNKQRKEPSGGGGGDGGGERERAAERAGLTVLELLELQARARAIKAQLNAENERKNAAASTAASAAAVDVASTSDDDVEIKEEPPEVVELVSSDTDAEAKPDLASLNVHKSKPAAQTSKTEPQPAEVSRTEDDTRIVIKRADLTITVPKAPKTRKIKLNRTKSNMVVITKSTEKVAPSASVKCTAQNKFVKEPETNQAIDTTGVTVVELQKSPKKDKVKKKKKTKRPKAADGSDHDEITLQLSDTEKMDLLEDFDRKKYDEVSSSSSDGEGNIADKPNDTRLIEQQVQNEPIVDHDNIKNSTISQDKHVNKSNTTEFRQTNPELATEDNTRQNLADIKEIDLETTTLPENQIAAAEIKKVMVNTEVNNPEVKKKSVNNTDEGAKHIVKKKSNHSVFTVDEVKEISEEAVPILVCDASVEGETMSTKSLNVSESDTNEKAFTLSESAEVSSEVDTTGKEVDSSETSKKTKLKKKSKKKVKKSRKDKNNKD